MALYLVGFSGQLADHAAAARAELCKWGATCLWDDLWVVEMDAPPETCLPGLVQTEAALSIPLDGLDAFFVVARAAGVPAQLAFAEQIAPRLASPDATRETLANLSYCNGGETVFERAVTHYLWVRRHVVWATDLCRIMARHGSDKGIGWHSYTPFYQALFHDRRDEVSAVFELGLGTNRVGAPSGMGAHGKPGASLRGWRDYFPNARIYGADIDSDVLFEEERIRTFFVDQCDAATFAPLWDRIGAVGFDLFVDDGLHTFEAARTTFDRSIDTLRSGGIYAVEDVPVGRRDEYLRMIEERGLPGLAVDILHPFNREDNCLVIAAVR